jgi:hypothetical protein
VAYIKVIFDFTFHMPKILFILKRREDFNAILHNHVGLSTGLYNSASFVNDMLNDQVIDSALEVAIDNNCIDRLVTKHRPTHVIIEALWVVPQKFNVLQRLHPGVTWIIRLHSEMPFMAGEGNAMDWLGDYAKFKNIVIGVNAPRMLREIRFYLKHLQDWTDEQAQERVVYLPNYYPQQYQNRRIGNNKDTIDISCFGAVRLLKNHLVQAFAAVEFADQIGKRLRFHVNAGRIEMQGGPVLNNLKGFFQHLRDRGHELINHQWTPREQFLQLCAQMDIGLQVSLSETFNIVGADLVSQGIPLVGTQGEIPWAVPEFCADPNDSADIIERLHRTWNLPELNVVAHQRSLTDYTNTTAGIWNKYFCRE